MRKVSSKKIIAAGLCCSLVITTVGCSALNNANREVPQVETLASDTDASNLTDVISDSLSLNAPQNADKDETVYVLADANGNVNKTIVSDWLKNSDRSEYLSDVSELKDINNVKGDETFEQKGNSIKWHANGNDIYYQGTTDKEIPVAVKVTYYLNDKEIKPEELAGKKGTVKIRFDYINKAKEKDCYVPFIMATGFMLDADKFTNVNVANGKLISDGGRFIIIGMGMPGLKDSLGIEAEEFSIPDYLEVTADTSSFSMAMAVTVATTTALTDKDLDVKTLEEKIGSLSGEYNKGMGELVKGIKDYTDGAAKVNDGVSQVFDGTTAVKDGALQVRDGASTLSDGVNQINDQVQNISLPSVKSVAGNMSEEEKQKTKEAVMKEAERLGAPSEDNLTASMTKGVTDAVYGSIDDSAPELKAVTEAAAADPDYGAAKVIGQTGATKGAALGEGASYLGSDGKAHTLKEDAYAAANSVDAETALAAINSLTTDEQKASIAALESQLVEANVTVQLQQIADSKGITVEQLLQAAPETKDQVTAAVKSSVESQMSNLYVSLYKAGYGSGYGTGFATGYGTGYANEYANLAGEFSNVMGNVKTNLSAVLTGTGSTIKSMCEAYAEAGANVTLSSVDEKINAFGGKIDTLKAAMNQAAAGSDKLKAGTYTLYDGTVDLNNGAETLYTGSKELTDNNAKLNDGADKLGDATSKIVDAINSGEADMDEVLGKLNTLRDLSDEYQSFTGLLDGKSGNVKFIIKTDGVSEK